MCRDKNGIEGKPWLNDADRAVCNGVGRKGRAWMGARWQGWGGLGWAGQEGVGALTQTLIEID